MTRPPSLDLEQRRAALKAPQERRDRLGLQLKEMEEDVDHYNRTHPNEKPLVADPGGVIARLIAELDQSLAFARTS